MIDVVRYFIIQDFNSFTSIQVAEEAELTEIEASVHLRKLQKRGLLYLEATVTRPVAKEFFRFTDVGVRQISELADAIHAPTNDQGARMNIERLLMGHNVNYESNTNNVSANDIGAVGAGSNNSGKVTQNNDSSDGQLQEILDRLAVIHDLLDPQSREDLDVATVQLKETAQVPDRFRATGRWILSILKGASATGDAGVKIAQAVHELQGII